MTRIALYCSSPAQTRGLESALRAHNAFELLPTARSLFTLICMLEATPPDLLLLDHSPEITSDVLAAILRRAAGARVVLWAEKLSTETAIEAMKRGVRGILRRNLPLDLQMKCLLKVRNGELWFEKALAEPPPAAARAQLTGEESRLISLLSQGLKNWEIAHALAVPEGKVGDLLATLFRKLGVKDRFELALFGLKNLAQRPGAAPAPSTRSMEERSLRALLPCVPTVQ